MNPVPQKTTVEIIPGELTSVETIDMTQQLLTVMGKEGVIVKDAPGFVINRVLMLTINEAIQLVQENIASVEDVDKIFKNCLGHKMGPLETADLIGLDIILDTLHVLSDAFNNDKYNPSELLNQMVEDGLLGRKSGQGFYFHHRSN